MAKADPEREERRRQQEQIADSLKQAGALDEIFTRQLTVTRPDGTVTNTTLRQRSAA